MKKNKNFAEISGNDITWWTDKKAVTELDDYEENRIAGLIREGYTQGELCISYKGDNGREYEASGWWEVVSWKNIALSLYNATTPEEIKKAKNLFDEYWN